MELRNTIEQTIVYLLTICASIVLFHFIKWKLSRQNLYKLAEKVPAVEGMWMLPLIGHCLYAFGTSENILARSRAIYSKITPPRKVWILDKLAFTINRAEDAEVVFNKCLKKYISYNFIEPIGGAGLFTLPVPTWKRHRKVINPAFSQKVLDGFTEIFVNKFEAFICKFDNKTEQLLDMSEYLYTLSLSTITETAMGFKTDGPVSYDKFEEAVVRGFEIAATRICSPLYYADWIYKLTSLYREEQKCSEICQQFIMNMVDKRIIKYQTENTEGIHEFDVKDQKTIFLDLLIQHCEDWSKEEIRNEVNTFMIAGSDTCATTVGFVMLLLGMHQDIQKKCYEEVMEVLGPDRQLHYTDLKKFVYLEKVLKESLRLFPAGPVVSRHAEEHVEVGGYTLPKDAGLVIFVLNMHYSEFYYKDPWKFDPEKFSQEEIAKRHKYAYLPFTAGPRNCIGQKYAIMFLKTYFAIFLRKYRIETVYKEIRDIRITQTVMIKPVEGFPVKLFPRN